MNTFFNQLKALVEKEPLMKKAVENVQNDCRSDDQPNGNIKPPVIESICNNCKEHAEEETGHLGETVRHHRSIERPDFYQPVSTPANEPLRRVTSLQFFVLYHMLESFRGKNLLGRSSDKHGSVPKLKKHLIDRFEDAGDEIDLDLDELEGSIGKHNEPTWWTFDEKGVDIAESGEIYMKELALGEGNLKEAEKDNTAIELSIDGEALGQDIFKPTALDAFIPETNFEPELTGKSYGYTAPGELGLQSRPEVVSASVPYRELRKNSTVTLKKYTYKANKKK